MEDDVVVESRDLEGVGISSTVTVSWSILALLTPKSGRSGRTEELFAVLGVEPTIS